jgi:1-acyl-sn-glycerol-3-phosphate acyltransferase
MLINFILFLIVYITLIIFIFIFPKKIIKKYIYIFTYLTIYLMGYSSIKINNLNIFNKYLNNDENIIIVCNHKSLFDSFILYALTKGNISFLFNENIPNIVPFCKYLLEQKCNCLVTKKKNTVNDIKYYVKKRKKGDEILCIFSDACGKIENNKNIAEFKSGAFVNKFKIIPIIIKYKNYKIDPTHKWYNNELFISILKLFYGESGDIIIDINEIIECKKEWNINDYKNYVYNFMNNKYNLI